MRHASDTRQSNFARQTRVTSMSPPAGFFFPTFGAVPPRKSAHVIPPAILRHGPVPAATCAIGKQKRIGVFKQARGTYNKLSVPPLLISSLRRGCESHPTSMEMVWMRHLVPNAILCDTCAPHWKAGISWRSLIRTAVSKHPA